MTHGLLIDNPDGRLVVSAELPTPHLVLKVPLITTGAPNAIDAGPWRITTFSYQAPPAGAFIHTQTVPDTGNAVHYSPVLSFEGNGQTPAFCQVAAVHLNNVAPTAPEVYRFGTGAVPQSGDTHGLRLYSAAGALTFDSGRRHFMPSGVFTRPPDGQSIGLGGMPPKPAFLLPSLQREDRYYFDEPDGQDNSLRVTGLDFTSFTGVFRRSGSSLAWSMWTFNFFRSYGAPSSDQGTTLWGTLANAGIVMLDASIYD